MIKKYKFLNSNHPDFIRTPDTLIKTVDYLFEFVLDSDIKQFPFQDNLNNKKEFIKINFIDILKFVGNRLKAILSDLILIGLDKF